MNFVVSMDEFITAKGFNKVEKTFKTEQGFTVPAGAYARVRGSISNYRETYILRIWDCNIYDDVVVRYARVYEGFFTLNGLTGNEEYGFSLKDKPLEDLLK